MPNIVRHCTAVLACLLALRATAGVAPWYFLPNFGEDIRGVERVAAGRFHETIPGVAETPEMYGLPARFFLPLLARRGKR